MNKRVQKFNLNGESLVTEYLKTGSDSLKEKIVIAYSPLVKYISGRIGFPVSSALTREDLYQYGIIGLLKALNNYRPDQGAEFKTYAYRRIHGEIIDGLRKEGIVSRERLDKVRQVENTSNRLMMELGRDPLPAEICEMLSITEQEYFDALKTAQINYTLSLDAKLAEDEGDSIYRIDTLPDESMMNPEENMDRTDLRDKLKKFIGLLSERQKVILALYFNEELTMSDIGQALGLTEARVSQILSKTLLELRSKLS